MSYDGYVGWQNLYRKPQMLNAKQYMQVMDLVAFNNGNAPYDWSKFMDADLLKIYHDGTDWLEELRTKNALTTSHAINVAGGTEMSKFSIGAGYQYQNGIFGGPVTSDFKRFTFRINSEHVLWKKGNLEIVKLGENLYYQHKENQGIKIGDMYANDISYMLRANPCVPVMSGGKYTMYENLNKAMTNPEKTFLYVSILASDDCLGGGGGNDQHMQACDLLRNSGADMTCQFWIDRYEGIQRANNLIASLEDKADELKNDGTHLMLCAPEPGVTDAGGTAWFWAFKRVNVE